VVAALTAFFTGITWTVRCNYTSGSCGGRHEEGMGVTLTVHISPIGDEETDGQTSLRAKP